jgi:hypothetical protein
MSQEDDKQKCAQCGKEAEISETSEWYTVSQGDEVLAKLHIEDCLARWAQRYSEEKYLTGVAREAFSKTVWSGETHPATPAS